MKSINFYFFSGTGNTLLVVKEMTKVFRENDYEVNIHKIEKTNPKEIDTDNIIGLAFPVAIQSTYPFIWDFIEKMPKVQNDTKIFMVDTLFMFSGGIVGPLRELLKEKGYKPIGAKEIRMPNNFNPSKIDHEKDKMQIEKGLESARKYAKSIIDGKSRWKRVPFFEDMMYYLSRSKLALDYLIKHGKKFTINKEKCTKCGTCIKLCPIGNIEMGEEYPEFISKCYQCMRCISFCPVEAIYIPDKKYEIYRAVKLKEMLKVE